MRFLLTLVVSYNNLALLQQYGSNAWRIHNFNVEDDVKKAEKMVEILKEEITAVNRDRKNAQVSPCLQAL